MGGTENHALIPHERISLELGIVAFTSTVMYQSRYEHTWEMLAASTAADC
jgi:hypothetical protein